MQIGARTWGWENVIKLQAMAWHQEYIMALSEPMPELNVIMNKQFENQN